MNEKRGSILHFFANLFIVWLSRRQMDSHTCFGTKSVMICCFGRGVWKQKNPDLIEIYSWKEEDHFKIFSR